MPTYARETAVSVVASKMEIERILERYGATRFGYMMENGGAVIGFDIVNRRVRIMLPLPDPNLKAFTHHSKGARTPEAARKEWEQACRQRWRALTLVIKAKLEACECNISTLEREFLSDFVLPNGRTVGETIAPQLELTYQNNTIPLLMEAS